MKDIEKMLNENEIYVVESILSKLQINLNKEGFVDGNIGELICDIDCKIDENTELYQKIYPIRTRENKISIPKITGNKLPVSFKEFLMDLGEEHFIKDKNTIDITVEGEIYLLYLVGRYKEISFREAILALVTKENIECTDYNYQMMKSILEYNKCEKTKDYYYYKAISRTMPFCNIKDN